MKADELLARIAEEVADDILALDDVALAALLRDASVDDKVLLAEGQESIAAAVEQADAVIRARARKDFENAAAAALQRSYRLPLDPATRRAMLNDAVRRNPMLGAGVTLQHRDLSELSDDDVTKQLTKLAELGVIDGVIEDEGDSE